MNYRLVQTESSDWFIVPDGKQEEFYEEELEGNIPAYGIYIDRPEDIVLIKWEIK